MQLKQAQENMLKQQLRTFGITDNTVLALFEEIPRELFVPENLQTFAYADVAIPIGHGQVMMPPKETAFMLQALGIKNIENVLIVGVESGYITALTAKLAKQVQVLDLSAELINQAKEKLSSLQINNVTFAVGDGVETAKQEGEYQIIIITGSLPHLPKIFRKNLARHGRIFAIIGNPPVMEASVLKRTAQGLQAEKLFEINHPRLPNTREPKTFVF